MNFKSILYSPWTLLPILSIVLRFFSFFPFVIDHDESTYIVIARDLLNNNLYFKEVIDTKPIGIFWIYALLEILTNNSIFWIRFLCALVTGLTAIFVFKFSSKWTQNKFSAWASAVIYLVSISVFKRWGVSPNTEIFFNLFTILSFYLILFNTSTISKVFAGVSFGFGFIIKYVILADILAISLFLLSLAFVNRKLIKDGLLKLVPIFIGFLLPLIIVIYYYYQNEALNLLYHFTFQVTSRYPSSFRILDVLQFYGDFIIRFLPLLIMGIFALKANNSFLHKFQFLFIVWIFLDILVISIPGKNFEHYFIQLLLPMSLLSGAFFSIESVKNQVHNFSRKWSIIASFIFLILILHFQKNAYYDKPEILRDVKAYLATELKSGETIYTGNYQQLLYFLLNLKSPTAYIHSSLLWNPDHIHALQIDLEQEINKILNTKPRFIVLMEPIPPGIFFEKIKAQYSINKIFENRILIWELNK
ncbi:MAG: glycosyltransferase family 39 protein [Saprospiraceae bacterium]|nr:glycosyltransferase family 39 protein [Saprospiraceae bacterium]